MSPSRHRSRDLDDLLRHATDPLDAATERRCIVAAQAGNAEAMNTLIRSNLPWIATVALGVRGVVIPLEDAVQEGVIGFMVAVYEFDVATGNRLNTITTRAVLWAIRRANSDYMRIRLNCRWMQPKWVEQIDPGTRELASIALGCGAETEIAIDNGTSPEGIYGGKPDPAMEALEAREAAQVTLGAWLPRLEARDREVMRLKHGEGRSFAEIGTLFGVSKQRVGQIEAKAMERLRHMARVGVGA